MSAKVEVFNTNPPECKARKLEDKNRFQQALVHFQEGEHQKAKEIFIACKESNPNDRAIDYYLERCKS